jgi:UDP-N-acetylglucosamine/UDP-N-acetylgalactosamine diphosphorylase
MDFEEMSNGLVEIKDVLIKVGQEWLIEYINERPLDQQQHLIAQIAQVDWQTFIKSNDEEDLLVNIQNAKAPLYEVKRDLQDPLYSVYHDLGEQTIKAGKVALLLVAGGLGSRLSFEGPKGIYPARPISKISLFEHFAQKIHVAQKQYGVELKWLVMTSPQNDEITKLFFRSHRYFGLKSDQIHFFCQNGLVAFDAQSNQVLLEKEDRLQLYPDGHGGMLSAFKSSGLAQILKDQGVEILSYFQVDNPLLKILDPYFIGLHLKSPQSSAQISSKIVEKTRSNEKVGLFMEIDQKMRLVEYHIVPSSLLEERDEQNQLKFRCASIAAHLVNLDFLMSCEANLPLYKSIKPLYSFEIESKKEVLKPAFKYERFFFDLIPSAHRPLIYQVLREDEFAPIKNRIDVDSPESSYLLQSDQIKTWLRNIGYESWVDALEEDQIIELNYIDAWDQESLLLAIQSNKITLPHPKVDKKIYLSAAYHF